MTLTIWCAPDTAPAQAMQWGDWVFNPKNLTLQHSIQRYTIRLWDIHTSASMLDWIFQIRNKAWADAKTMHDLLRALQDILHPQQNYCSFERDLRADGGKLAREFAERVKRTGRRWP